MNLDLEIFFLAICCKAETSKPADEYKWLIYHPKSVLMEESTRPLAKFYPILTSCLANNFYYVKVEQWLCTNKIHLLRCKFNFLQFPENMTLSQSVWMFVLVLSLQRNCSLNLLRTIQKKSQNMVSTVDAQQLWGIFLSTIECSHKCYNYYHMKLLQNHSLYG